VSARTPTVLERVVTVPIGRRPRDLEHREALVGSGLHRHRSPGAPAITDAVQVTSWAPTCAQAEVAATVALLRGTRAVADAPSVIVGRDGTIFHSVTSSRSGEPSDEPEDEVAA
jgi:hypothetical protein